MKRIALLIAVSLCGGIAAPALAGLGSKCAPLGLLGGYRQHDLGDGLWRINVLGNGVAGKGFVKTCTLERARAIAGERGFSRFAVVSFQGSFSAFRGNGDFVRGSSKAVIKLLKPGENADAIEADRVAYFDTTTGRLERDDAWSSTADVALADTQ